MKEEIIIYTSGFFRYWCHCHKMFSVYRMLVSIQFHKKTQPIVYQNAQRRSQSVKIKAQKPT